MYRYIDIDIDIHSKHSKYSKYSKHYIPFLFL